MLHPLTPAELRALHALARYENIKDAADALGISVPTIRNQSQSAYRKLNVKNRTAAFRQMGWLRPPRQIFAARGLATR